jgi:dTDP-4-dehydrorhamnose reductase
MKILITGGSSLLGKSLIETAPEGWEVESTWYTNYVGLPMYQMNVCDKSQVAYVVDRVRPDVVVHCAITTKVEDAERRYETARQVCVSGTGNVAKAADEVGALFVFPSTNAVFGGDAAPYREGDPREPVNFYGEIRKSAENAIQYSTRWLAVRLFLLYGWPWPKARTNWGARLAEGLGRGERFKLVDDRWWQPTYAPDAAAAVWRLIGLDLGNEIFHVASPDRVTLHDFGLAVADIFGYDRGLVEPVSSDAFPGLAERPVDSTYDTSKAEAHGVRCRGILSGLEAMRKSKP